MVCIIKKHHRFFGSEKNIFYLWKVNLNHENTIAMKYVSLPDNDVRPLPFYLAMEEYVARRFYDEAFFMWQVNPTVIFGRNQLVDNEVNMPYCRQHGIAVFRRKSGGGCVYADMDNIMFSYVVSSDDVVTTFSNYTERVAAMLRGLGVAAESSGRNDVTIGGRKVSGNAFYHIPGRSIVHGTMLYDTDLAHMSAAISPSGEKLRSKGVDSVRSHITVLREHTDISIDEFKRYVRLTLCDGEISLDAEDVARIEEMSRPYFADKWIYGKNPRCSRHHSMRIDGVGEFFVEIELKGGRIVDLNFAGDYFQVGDIDLKIIEPLRGVDYTREAVGAALAETDPSEVIASLDIRQLINLIIPDNNGK